MPRFVEIICKSENKKPERKSFGFFGAPAGIRTPDTLLKRQVLCRLSYWGKSIIKLKGWQGWLDSNQRMRESKSLALPLGYTPIKGGEIAEKNKMGWEMGFEPTTPGTTIRCSNQLSYTHHIKLVRQEGFEPPTYCLEGSCSIQLSYWRS